MLVGGLAQSVDHLRGKCTCGVSGLGLQITERDGTARRDVRVVGHADDLTHTTAEVCLELVGTDERRGKGGSDLLSELIRAESEDGKLSEDELVTTAILLLNAGHEATVHALGNGIKALLEENARNGIGEGHVEEIMRFDAPLHMFTRYALEDMDWNGLRLKKGEVIGLLLGAANRDPVHLSRLLKACGASRPTTTT